MMTESMQITFMQARLVRMISERWNMTIPNVASMFQTKGVFRFIRECFDTFHVEGDEAIYDDVEEFLISKGATKHE